MDPTEKRTLGRTRVEVTQLGFGGASIGSMFHHVSEDDAREAFQAAWDAGIRFFDTSPWYGRGLSERRTGTYLRQQPRGDYVLSSKVGRVLRAARDPSTFDTSPWAGGLPFEVVFDYSYDGIMRSYEDSLQRLGIPGFDLAVIHDLDFTYHKTKFKVEAYLAQLATSGFRALEELRNDRGLKGVGAGINELGMMPRFLDALDLDFFLVAMPYTLMDQDVLDVEFPRLEERNVGVVLGSPFASGILAVGPVEGAKYNYADPSPEHLDKVRRIQEVCEGYRVPLPAAALQFPFGHPLVATVIPGARNLDQMQRNIDLFKHPIPSQLWADLKTEGLVRADAPVPDEPAARDAERAAQVVKGS